VDLNTSFDTNYNKLFQEHQYIKNVVIKSSNGSILQINEEKIIFSLNKINNLTI
jgi:hypothetical protein